MYQNTSDFTALASSSSEGSIISGSNRQPVIPALYWDGVKAFGRGITLVAQGVLSTTSTPTIIFQVRTSSTVGTSTLSGSSVGVSAAITTASGVTSKWWMLVLDLVCTIPGQSTGNTTIAGAGYVTSPGGFASPFIYPLEITTPDTATWTQTLDNTLTQYINASCTWSASSSSNTITAKHVRLHGWN